MSYIEKVNILLEDLVDEEDLNILKTVLQMYQLALKKDRGGDVLPDLRKLELSRPDLPLQLMYAFDVLSDTPIPEDLPGF